MLHDDRLQIMLITWNSVWPRGVKIAGAGAYPFF